MLKNSSPIGSTARLASVAIEALDRRELGFLDPPLDGPAFAFDHLQLGAFSGADGPCA
jgi:hypothetical protein